MSIVNDLARLPPGVKVLVAVMLWPAIWAAVSFAVTFAGDVIRHSKKQSASRVEDGALLRG